jgi:cytochrome oxidase Cu insertion factor (SCO1/SenC/PrrC family)
MSGEHVDERALPSAPGVPRRFVALALLGALVLGTLGVVGDHFFGGHVRDVGPAASASSAAVASGPGVHQAAPIAAPLARFLGASALAPRLAPALSLFDQDGQRVSLSTFLGKVVVLSFFDAACDDICPVLGRELALADAALGTLADRVELVAVNTDPLVTSVAAVAATSHRLQLASEPNWRFVTGPLSALDAVWTHYGVTVVVSARSRRVAHTEVLYLIDPKGRERWSLTPFADQLRSSGKSVLSKASEERFGLGIAHYVRALLGSRQAR